MSRVTRPAVAVLALGLALSTATAVQAAPAGSPGAPGTTDPIDRALAAVIQNPGEYGLSAVDTAQLRVSSVVPAGALTHVYFQQQVDGIDVAEAILNVTLDDRGVVHTAGNTIKAAAGRANASVPKLSDVAAARAAARALDLTPTESFATSRRASGVDRTRELGDGGVSTDPIPANLVYQRAAGGKLRLAWQLGIRPEDGESWWQIRMDAATGKELARADWVAHADESYEVYELPIEAPTFGDRTIVEDPADATASPFGWLDNDGVAGADTALTNGNNVHAYTDVDDNDVPDAGSEADGGAGHGFLFPLDLAQPPSTYRDAAVTNLFYANNRIHDLLYGYGFDEAAGNFQANNYGNGGQGGDAVMAEAQDGAERAPTPTQWWRDNANFATPPDGQAPRMQMYLWTGNPERDGDFDNGVIAHEYGHGVSNRLTGGPATASCLANGEQAGEGWSDFIAYILTMPSGDEPVDGRGIGTYALGQPTNGVGIRTQRYSRNPAINTMNYDDIKVAFDNEGVLPHDVGEVWGQMLWEMTWNLIDEHGYGDLDAGTGGNSLALKLVLDGMKLQSCSPGFVDGRDAILAADELSNDGANSCAIWTAFAKHGLGYSALQGSSSLITDGIEAYDVSPECEGLVVSAATATPTATPTRDLDYQVTLKNTGSVALNDASATATVPVGASYLDGTCAAAYDQGTRVVTFNVGSLASGASAECAFSVRVSPSAVTDLVLDQGFDGSLAPWTTATDLGPEQWVARKTRDAEADVAWGTGADNKADHSVISAPFVVRSGDELHFDQRFSLERDYDNLGGGGDESAGGFAYDGGQVLISTDAGGTWDNLDAEFTENGPDLRAMTFTDGGVPISPVAGERVFSGDSGGWQHAAADLSDWAGETVQLRFRVATDIWSRSDGWWIEDVQVGRRVRLAAQVTASADGLTSRGVTVSTPVTSGAPDAPTAVKAMVLSKTSARVTFTAPGYDGDSSVTGYRVSCAAPGGVSRTASGAMSPLLVTGLSAGRSYVCTVQAENAVGAGLGAVSAAYLQGVKPSAPKVTKVKALGKRKLKVTLKEGDDGGLSVSRYAVTCRANGGKTRSASGARPTLTVTKLTAKKKYTCRARATTKLGTSAWGKPSKKVRAR
ncbi:M36 family metallopeptidase [Nocardioides sp. Bht2]|uniref:M36 family metallopeptidase n=1 Tax=Nocardioides sp. Bht2 TaxID=3392297 RepID=UPI0039B63DFC